MRSPGSSIGRRRGPGRRAAAKDPDLCGVPLLEIRFDSPPRGHALADLLQKEGGEAHLIACRLTDGSPRRLVRWLDVEVDPERMDPFLTALRARMRTRHLGLSRLGPGRVLLRLSEPAPAICAATHEAGGICVRCPLLGTKERESWRIILPRGARTNAFVRDLPSGSITHRAIARVGPYRSPTTLTRHQDRALRVAYDLGYFDYPRRATLGDVARTLGTGRSSTLEVLRRGSAKLAGRRYGEELKTRVLPEGPRGTLRSLE